jgi:aldose sugar dehydrogenase
MRKFRVIFPAAALLAACNPQSGAVAQDQPGAAAAAGLPFKVTPVADFDAPWAMTFLPDGWMLVTEKAGSLLLVSPDGNQRHTIATLPVDSSGQGGLMDVVLAPDFAESRHVYLSYSTAGEGGKGVVLVRGQLRDGDDVCSTNNVCWNEKEPELTGVTELFRASPFVEGNGHYSGRIAFSPDGKYLFFTNGERQKFDPAQDPKATLGKVLRLTLDGKPAPGNPLAAKGFHPAVWSYGHRNLLGIAFDAKGNLWEQEMGPKGGDEVNLILPGRNYGYPLVSDGSHYDGRDIPDHATRPDLEKYKVNWTPVISPGGLMAYSGKMFPEWQGDLFIGGLSSKSLVRVDVNGTNAAKGDQWPMGARIREVEQGPDGAIWLLEDGDDGSQGRLLRLTRAG